VFSLSPIKLVIIVAVILVVLGPDKLPEVANQIGGAWRSLREWQSRIEKEVREVVPDLPSTADIARIARSPVHLLNSLADRLMEPVGDDAETELDAQPDAAPDDSNVAAASLLVPDSSEADESSASVPNVPAEPRSGPAAGALAPPPDPSLN
jgi:TatA/E family protein of Tat protein translocase